MPWRWIVTAAALLILVVLYSSISWTFTSRLIGVQFPAAPEIAFADFGLPQPEDVTITIGDINLSGWYFDNPANAGCGVVMLHGYSGNKGGIMAPTPLFWDRGCDLLLYDLRGHGESSEGDHTYGVLDRKDQIAALDWFIERTGLPENKVGLIGWSYGAATSILTAAERPGLAFVISDASYSSLRDIAKVQAGALFGNWAKAFVPGALILGTVPGRFRSVGRRAGGGDQRRNHPDPPDPINDRRFHPL